MGKNYKQFLSLNGKDLSVILLIALVTYLISYTFDLADRIFGPIFLYETFQLDELLVVSIVVSIISIAFLWYRLAKLRSEMAARKKVEQKFRDSQRILSTLMDNLPDEIFTKDREHRFTMANHVVLNKFGLKSPDEIIGKTDFDFHPQKVAQVYYDEEEELFTTGKPIINKEHYSEFSGSGVWFISTKVPIKDEQGKIIGLVGINRNITTSKLAEQSLKDSEEKYRTVVENANEVIIIAQDGYIKFANPKTESLLDFDRDYICSVPFTNFIHPDDRQLVYDNYVKRLRGDPSLPEAYEFRVINKQGEIRWVEVRGVRSLWEGKPATLNFLVDVTERKMAHNMLQASLKEKEVLLKEIHHRVKNNMQIISSLLSLQASKVKDNEAIEALRDSQNRVKTMAYIHEKLYQSENLSEIEFGQYVEKLIKQLFASYHTDMNKVKLNLQVNGLVLDVNKAIPCGLIINELVSNALKHAFPNGRTGEITVCFNCQCGQNNKKEYDLCVMDTGVGFPEDVNFMNTDSLGMQLVCTLTEQINGSIEMENKNGTKFIIKFPKSDKD